MTTAPAHPGAARVWKDLPGPARHQPRRGVPVIVCHCRVVNDAAIAQAVEDGAATLAQVCRVTGAGGDCGSCVFSVRRLLCQHDVSQPPRIPEVYVAAS